jgi:hypothetical protein
MRGNEVAVAPPVYTMDGSPERSGVELDNLPNLLPRTWTRILSITKPARISVKSATLGTPGFEQRIRRLPLARKRLRKAATVVGLTTSQSMTIKSCREQFVRVANGVERTRPSA